MSVYFQREILLLEALNEFKKNRTRPPAPTLGAHIYENMEQSKKCNWDARLVAVTDWELENYLKSLLSCITHE